ncbi:hypothetical protein HETIRDRAFT_455084 [Heterobasidion irregulare TC 32-1]|uniref:MPN domain-containing protein n=1 Tax=Heterobasidion irregulare (strain TC 32-1) TaxID=747525 RepID=W4JTX9_HETIT|nr:uncharacterized protein HETIRDRAFT_455084 [Heterobasidion irregulare TC 32-1]ETW76555.1 hypothetical protein HETIRDRAFT_455084 [Heterobasidion irregulare TC 32-1]
MANYTISDLAYTKIVLHSLKHPQHPVNGVLLGAKDTKGVQVVDTIPLLHHWTSLSPMMEIGLDLANGHAESRGLALVGYYQASERVDDNTLKPVGERVATKVREGFPDALAVVVDGTKLGSETDPALVPYLPTSGSSTTFRSAPPTILTLSNSAPALSLHLSRARVPFSDFDDHLEDVRLDWLQNEQVEEALKGVKVVDA